MFGCMPECKAISNREIIATFQEFLEHDYVGPQVIRVLEVETFKDNSVRANMRFNRGNGVIVDRWYGFHYCEHDDRIIIDFVA